MAGCCERMESLRCPDLSEQRNNIAAFLSGLLFFIGWWFVFDVAANDPFKNGTYYIPGVVSTLAMIMVNMVSNAQVRGDAYDSGCLGQTGVRLWLLVSFLMAFGGLIGACYVLFGEYVAKDEPNSWPGVAAFLQNAAIFFSAIIFKFGRIEDD